MTLVAGAILERNFGASRPSPNRARTPKAGESRCRRRRVMWGYGRGVASPADWGSTHLAYFKGHRTLLLHQYADTLSSSKLFHVTFAWGQGRGERGANHYRSCLNGDRGENAYRPTIISNLQSSVYYYELYELLPYCFYDVFMIGLESNRLILVY